MPPKKPTRRTKVVAEALDPTSLTPAGQVAHEILAQRFDLRPSVEAILGAGLSDADAMDALGLFQTALSHPGDPHRDPRAAIATIVERTTR
jgi:hypothetical protein